MVEKKTISIPDCRGECRLADFGRDAFSRLEAELTGQGGETVKLAIGEVLYGGRLHREPGGYRCFRKMLITLKPGTHTYRFDIPTHTAPDPTKPKCAPTPEAGGEVAPFRYVEISGYHGIAKLTRYAFFGDFDDNAADFDCSDDRLKRIWDFCKYSVKATSCFGCYIDGERERLPYEGDAYINQLSHFCCDRKYDMARRTIEYFFSHPTWPAEWRLITVLLARDYRLYSGDTETVKSYLPELRKKLLPELAGKDFLLRGNDEIRDIVDWPYGERDGYEFGEVNFVPNCYYCGALGAMHELTGDIRYLRQMEKVRSALRKSMFRNGLFTDSPGSNHTSLHSAVFAIRFGIAAKEDIPALKKIIRQKGMACSVFGAQFLLESSFMSGMADHAVSLMTGNGLRSWQNMLDKGATITMEAWDDSLKPNQDWNHAWGSAPANIIPRYLCGIRPAKPGFAEFTVAPQPGKLKYFRCKQPTVHGDIVLEMEDGIGELTVPENCTAVCRTKHLKPGKHRIIN